MLDLEKFLPYRLSLVSNLISQGIAETYQPEFDLSVTEWRVLAVLGRYPGTVAAEVVARTAMDKVAVSRAVRRLLDKALIERQCCDTDRRSLHLYLSGQGQAIYARVVPAALAFEQRLLAVLSPGERAQLDRSLQKLTAAANDLAGARKD